MASQKRSDKVTTNPRLALLASPEPSAWDHLFTDESLSRSLRDPRALKQPCGYQSLGLAQCQTKTAEQCWEQCQPQRHERHRSATHYLSFSWSWDRHPAASTSQVGPSCSQVVSSQHHPAGSPAPSHAIHQLPGPFNATTKSSLSKPCAMPDARLLHKDHEERGPMSVWH